MSNLTFTGKVIAILDVRSGVSKSGNAWTTQEYVIESSEQYPKRCCFSVFGEDKIKAINIQMGETITAHIDIDARQWEDRWFNSIQAWKVEREGANSSANGPQAAVQSSGTEQNNVDTAPIPSENNDALPF